MDAALFETNEPQLKRLQFLWEAAKTYAVKNPEISRHLISQLDNMVKKQNQLEKFVSEIQHEYCQHCHSILHPDNHVVRLKAKLKLNQRICKLQRRAERGVFLSNNDRKMIRRWENASNKLSVLCCTCNKRSLITGSKRLHSKSSGNRHLSSSGRSSIGSYKGSPHTPANHNRSYDSSTTPASRQSWHNTHNTPSHSTPYNTPASARINTPASSTPPSSSSSRKKMKKGKHQQLQSMLASAKREKSASSKSPLSAFLQTL